MTATAPPPAADLARARAAEVMRRWRQGEPPDAAAAVAADPDLARSKSVVVDLAYEEFLLREKAGEAVDPAAFAARFPAFHASVRNLLDAHQLLVERPDLLDPSAAPWPEAGTAFEGLDLLADLGRGAFGHAYLAFDPPTDRLCVLKLSTGRSAEAKVIGRLAHPHVTDVYWARAVGTRSAVCMPFVGVSTLEDAIAAAFPAPGAPPPATAGAILRAAEADGLAGQADRRSAPLVRADEPYLVGACAVAARVAGAVAYLHAEGVVHGDLKPSNVVVGPGGAPHLIDFNLAAADAAPARARGTPAYMAPELLDGTAAAAPGAAARADVFSLGVVVYELLTGRLPFAPGPAGTLAALAAAVRAGRPARPAALPPRAAAVLAAALDPDPARRPPAAAVAAALDHVVDAHRGRGARRRRRAAVAACAVLAGAVVAAAFVTRPVREPATGAELFDRGRAALAAGDVGSARADFLAAHDRGDPRALAFAAHALALAGDHPGAADAAGRAIRAGAASAAVYNTLGYSLSQSGRHADALQALDEAVRRGALPAAHYNRALTNFKMGVGGGKGIDPRAADDVAAALAGGLSAPEVHFNAVRIFAACSDTNPALKAAALEQVRAGVRAGVDPERFRADSLLRLRLGERALDAALAVPRGVAPDPAPQVRLVEPSATF